MADQTPLKELIGERNRLWAEARLKGLTSDTPQRQRVSELDAIIRARKEARAQSGKPEKAAAKPDGTAGKASKPAAIDPDQ